MIRGSDGTMRFEAAAFSGSRTSRITVWEGEGVAINNAFRCEVRDSYIHDAAWSDTRRRRLRDQLRERDRPRSWSRTTS